MTVTPSLEPSDSEHPKPVRVGVLDLQPIYYRAPLYRRLARDPRIDLTVIFATSVGLRAGELGYSAPIKWDVDLLSGYRSVFLPRAHRNEIGGFFSLWDPHVIRVLAREQFDVLWLFGYNFATHFMAALYQKFQRGPLLFREDQTLLHPRPPLKAALKEVTLHALFKNAYALYVGTENRRWFEHYGVPRARLFATPCSVDNEFLQPLARQLSHRKEELRRNFGITPDAGPVILTVARLIPEKQPFLLLEAFRRVRQEKDCALLVVGSGSLESELRRAASGIADVHFTGFMPQSRIAEAYAAADVFTLSSYYETWGVAVNEAMNFALPIVVTDKVGSAADLVRAGENGFIVPADDSSQLASRLGALVDSEELRTRFGRVSTELIRNWGPDQTAAGVLEAVAASVGTRRWRAANERWERSAEDRPYDQE